MDDDKLVKIVERACEELAIKEAKQTKRSVTYTAHDGCEVTATPNGDIFYNMADWY